MNKLKYTAVMEEETITTTKKEYDQLVEDSRILAKLRAAGVNNWEGYEEAQDMED